MPIIQYKNRIWNFLKIVLGFLRLTKPFYFTVEMQPHASVDRILNLSQPKTGFFNAVSRTVKITEEVAGYRFEICIKRYGRGLDYNSVKVSGIIESGKDNAQQTVIRGDVRLGITPLMYPLLFLGITLTSRLDDFIKVPIFYILVFVVCFFYFTRALRDYRNLESLLQDTFSESAS